MDDPTGGVAVYLRQYRTAGVTPAGRKFLEARAAFSPAARRFLEILERETGRELDPERDIEDGFFFVNRETYLNTTPECPDPK
ncbi:hypothetical protein [Chloracidobacterium thermophilum]|uniref:hypothetical protein n=1 Tax=Chloracidobacterium thermophilum TaxID=458033 RepID=UPI000738CA21|nr:hypothetical protein [Chloracidobacterium thermophilum]